MSEKILLKVADAKGNIIKEVEDFELPTDFSELEILPGKEKTLSYVRNQMKIMERAKYKVHGGKPSVLPKETSKELRDALKAGDFTEDDLKAFIASRRR